MPNYTGSECNGITNNLFRKFEHFHISLDWETFAEKSPMLIKKTE